MVRMEDSRKAHTRTWRKMKFQAFRSDSQTLADTQKLVAPQQFHVNNVIFASKPLVSMIKNTGFKRFLSHLRKINHQLLGVMFFCFFSKLFCKIFDKILIKL